MEGRYYLHIVLFSLWDESHSGFLTKEGKPIIKFTKTDGVKDCYIPFYHLFLKTKP